MVLAIWLGAWIEQVRFNYWILGGLFLVALLCTIARLLRRADISAIENSPIAALWVVTRFVLTPALLLIAIAYAVCLAFGLAAAGTLLNALILLGCYGGSAILATAALADLAAAIKGPRRDSPSDP
jgi:hypothetical protein